eukprot:TRINITY_DN94029_c0_g1_i1.p1 TRINITY_DN94029_c0_g1~~TRINITY_DN94029_c0_g1_i1.p1  ORF type:complete len:382 (+),score=73.60 TRINITY_DN94029_c0_g1_i1:176-1321(+)
MIRRTVPNDNSCLFYSLAYVCEDGKVASHAVEQGLRKIVADQVKSDPDPETRALFLGKPVDEYATWIMNTMHWGGENEIVVLAEHFKVEVAVISCEGMNKIVYGQGPTATGRVYILYTGQHYDPLVAGAPGCTPDMERRVHPIGDDAALEAAALQIAREHNVEAARKAAQKRVKKIKCSGCGVLLESNEAFQEHCMDESVEHPDDFAYTCEEVEVIYEGGEGVPEDTVDLTDESKVVTFYNSKSYGFSNFSDYPVQVNSVMYRTGEHAWQCLKYETSSPDLAAKIRDAPTVDDAHTISNTDGRDKQRGDWDDVKLEVLLSILRAKFSQHDALKAELLATGHKLIVNIDTDKWAGMSAAGGIPTGQNNVGKALMKIRDELAA